jgi:hypothetical protein
MTELAKKNAAAIGAGHTFIISGTFGVPAIQNDRFWRNRTLTIARFNAAAIRRTIHALAQAALLTPTIWQTHELFQLP